MKEVGLDRPLVVRLEGTNVEAGKKLLRESGLAVIAADDLRDGCRKAAEAAAAYRKAKGLPPLPVRPASAPIAYIPKKGRKPAAKVKAKAAAKPKVSLKSKVKKATAAPKAKAQVSAKAKAKPVAKSARLSLMSFNPKRR